MNIATVCRTLVPAALLAGASVVIAASPTMDGTRDASFGTTAMSAQKASVIDITLATLNGSAQANLSNIGGVVKFAGGSYNFPAPDSDPALVTTGFELAVDLSEIGWDGVSPINLAGYYIKDGSDVNGHKFISNQIIGGLPAATQDLGDASVLDLSTVAGNQYITVTNVNATAATVDGTVDAAYGAPVFVNTLASTLPAATTNSQDASNGSEFDAIYAYRSATRLYVAMTGNLRTQYDKICLWVDCKSGGQNPVLTGNFAGDFGIINNHAGMKFDTGFTADYFIDYTGGPGGDHYVNYATLPTAAGGTGGYARGDKNIPVGERRVLAFPGMPTTNGQAAPPNGGSMEAAFNNSNSGGVAAATINLNPWTTPPGSDPNLVTTGVEIKVPLAETGWVTGTSSIRIGGFILGFNWDYLSNQIIGGVAATQDSFGFPANGVDFTSTLNAGNQYVTYSVPGTLFAFNNVLDGTKDASGYTKIWSNNVPANYGNPTGFGDNTLADVNHNDGSEIDGLYARAGLDPANGNAPTLWLLATGNLHDNNKLCLFLDTKAGGQQTMLANNPAFGLEKLGASGSGPGLKWDTGFEPDYMVAYAAGYDTGTATANHTLYAAQLLTAGGGYGGIVATGVKSGTTPVLTGTFRAKNGFGNNTLTTTYNANGSELDSVFAQKGTSPVDGSATLYLFFAGNLEPNNNKLDIFFDVIPGVGQNTLIYDDPSDGYTGNPDVDFSGLNRMGGPISVGAPPVVQPGLTFETGFGADYYVYVTNNNANATTGTADIYAGWARLKDVPSVGDPGAKRYYGKTTTTGAGFFDGGDLLTNEPAVCAINNSNTGGVAGGANQFVTPTSDPATVTTGIEIGIPIDNGTINDLAPWDGTTGTIKMIAFINGQNHDFVSNQGLQAYCSADLGEPRLVNFQTIPGTQSMTLSYNAGNQTYSNTTAGITTCTPPCVGDINNDHAVNTADLTLLLGNFGRTGPNLQGDLNGDNQVNTADLTILLGRFGQPC